MSPRMSTLAASLVAMVAAAATAGCHTSLERDKREVVTAVGDRRPPGTAREAEHVPNPDGKRGARALDDLREAAEEVRREREDVAEAAARERIQYRKLVAKEIASTDKRVVELQHELTRAQGASKDTKERDISAARGWRARLKQDLEDLDHTDENDWPELKERIDRDLEDERPASVPRSLDKSYAI